MNTNYMWCGNFHVKWRELLISEQFFRLPFQISPSAINKRICFSFRLFPLKALHAYAIPTIHIRNYSIKLSLCAAFICLVYLLLTFHMMDSLHVFHQWTRNTFHANGKKYTPTKITNPCTCILYTYQLASMQTIEPFIHFYLNKIHKFQFTFRVIVSVACSQPQLNHKFSYDSQFAVKCFLGGGGILFLIHKQLNAPLKVTSDQPMQMNRKKIQRLKPKLKCIAH